MLAFSSLMRLFSSEPWFLVAMDTINTVHHGFVPVAIKGSHAELRSSSQSMVAGLAEVAPPLRPHTQSASARQSPLVVPVALGSGDAGDPMVVDSDKVRFHPFPLQFANLCVGTCACSCTFTSQASPLAICQRQF